MAITVFDYMQAVQKVIADIPKETETIINNNSEKIIDLNRDDQLFELGINSDGSLLKPYSNTTILFKRQEGKPYNRTTLFDTGAFYNGFKLIVKYPIVSIYSTDEKSSMLQDDYGSNIFGLTIENQRKLNYEIIKPQLDAFIKRFL